MITHLLIYNCTKFQVITYLLDQGRIEVNSRNARGLTPLDILLVSSWDSVIDGSLVNTLRKAGGQEGVEEGIPESNCGKLKQSFLGRNRDNENARNDAEILLVVATLVATMTFPAISNPPGGFHEQRPMVYESLKLFFWLDSVALFSAISVILILLCGVPKTKIVIKFLDAVVWFAALFTAMAFASAFHVVWEGYELPLWIYSLQIIWSIACVAVGLWAAVRVVVFLWRKGGFKTNRPNWICKIGWPKYEWFRKITSIIFILWFLGFVAFSLFVPVVVIVGN
jgi:Domain of unknown function